MADAAPTSGALAVLAQLRTLWGKLGKGKRLAAIGVLVVIAAVVGISTVGKKTATWSIVADGASPDDAQELLATLEARGVPTRLTAGKVLVPVERVDEARAIAAGAGLPRTGKGFELFDGASLGQSSFVEQVNYRRALQGELARSIMALGQVQGARVHLALGKRSVFKEQQEPPSASVALHLHAGQTLTSEQVRGIRQLVAASVEGMPGDAVVVVDNHGNLLDGGEPGAADKRTALESSLTMRVHMMLERVVGPGKVSVVTTAVIDDSKISETQEVYDQTNPVLRSESRTVEGNDVKPSAMPNGVAQNAGNLQGTAQTATGQPGQPAPTTAAATNPAVAGSGAQRLQETRNFEVNRTVRQTTKPEAQLQRLHLAVVVDYKTGTDGKPVARTADELAELTALARQAAGIDDARGDKIEVRSIPFAIDPDSLVPPVAPVAAPSVLPVPPLYLAIGGGGALVLLVAVALFLRARKRRARATRPMNLALPVPVRELERMVEARNDAVQSPAGLGLPEGSTAPALPPGKPVRERVLDAVRGDIERTAEILTAWLSELPAVKVPAKGAKS